ncbi:MAG: acylphosphatase [Nitrospiraceae bacterium]|nr:MAG: acylphosphatase [Nitrospiraceae bacterium]
MMEMCRAHVIISGLVQGVFFRASTRDKALSLELKGWVRNLPNGDVEAVFEGPLNKVKQAVQWCNYGPRGARVKNVTEEWGEYKGEFNGFDVVHGYD